MYYFAYGNNIIKEEMYRRCKNAKFIAKSLLKKFKFIINSRGVATIISDNNSIVEGILWEINPEDLDVLDKYEGVNLGYYFRKYLSVVNEDTNDEYNVIVYMATDETIGVPLRDYLERIVNAAENYKFRGKYIKYLRILLEAPPPEDMISRDKWFYLENSKRWLTRAKDNTPTPFSKFFYLWASFNALYNLEGNEGDMSQIKSLISKIPEESAGEILNKQEDAIDYFFRKRRPIIDMKRMSNNETKSWQKKFIDSTSYKNKLTYIALTLYIVRNNLTHGSKMGSGDDLSVVENANCILREIIRKCVEIIENA